MNSINIAIDGPASSGKSTVAKIIAKNLNYTYLDTGAMYRCATYLALQHGYEAQDVSKILGLLAERPISFGKAEDGSQTVFLGTEEVTLAIRQNDVTNNVSWVSAIPGIREELVNQQRRIAKDGAIIMDGRDIGTVVLPDAELKSLLGASVDERAERRFKENQEKGIETDFETLKAEIERRDYLDSTREVSPLVQASDAVKIDTTGLTIEEVVAAIQNVIKQKGFELF